MNYPQQTTYQLQRQFRQPSQAFPFGPYGGASRLERFRSAIDERGIQYGEDWFAYTVTATDIAHGATVVIPINIQRDSVFECVEIVASCAPPSDDRYAGVGFPINVTLIDSVSSRNLMSAPIPLLNIAGTGPNPFVLPIPRRFMPTTQVSVVLTNYGTSDAIDVYFSLIGRKLYKKAMPQDPRAAPLLPRFNTWRDANTGILYAEDLYMYDFLVASLAAAASQAVTDIIEGDSDFEWIETCLSANAQSGDTTVDPTQLNLTVQIKDGGAERNLLSQATLGANVAGYAQYPHVLKQSRMFLSKTPVTVTFANIDSSRTYVDIHLTMIGRKIFELNE